MIDVGHVGFWLLHIPDYGDVPTWAATIAAVIAGVFAVRAYVMERDRDKRSELLRRQEQASKIAVWAQRIETVDMSLAEAHMDLCQGFCLRNASDLPVYDVQVYSYKFNAKGAPNTSEAQHFDHGFLPPSPEPKRQVTRVPVDSNIGYVYAVSFRDANNQYWYRNRKGLLSEGEFPDQGKFGQGEIPQDLFDRRAYEVELAAQATEARLVTAWIKEWVYTGNNRTVRWVLHNGSAEDFHTCSIELIFTRQDGTLSSSWHAEEAIPPLQDLARELELPLEAADHRPYVDRIIFTDALQRRWERTPSHGLRFTGYGTLIPPEAI